MNRKQMRKTALVLVMVLVPTFLTGCGGLLGGLVGGAGRLIGGAGRLLGAGGGGAGFGTDRSAGGIGTGALSGEVTQTLPAGDECSA